MSFLIFHSKLVIFLKLLVTRYNLLGTRYLLHFWFKLWHRKTFNILVSIYNDLRFNSITFIVTHKSAIWMILHCIKRYNVQIIYIDIGFVLL